MKFKLPNNKENSNSLELKIHPKQRVTVAIGDL